MQLYYCTSLYNEPRTRLEWALTSASHPSNCLLATSPPNPRPKKSLLLILRLWTQSTTNATINTTNRLTNVCNGFNLLSEQTTPLSSSALKNRRITTSAVAFRRPVCHNSWKIQISGMPPESRIPGSEFSRNNLCANPLLCCT